MIQFQKYPIYILYSDNSQRGTWAQEDAFWGDDHMQNWIKTTLKPINELEDDKYQPMYRQKAASYESFIKSQLDTILSTHIGQMLMVQFNPNVKTYIIPDPNIPSFTNKDRKKYYAYALTNMTKDRWGNDSVRIHINSDGETGDFNETLFHELVHAARYSTRLNFSKEIFSKSLGFISSEEFIASQMANIYRSSLGNTQLSLYYTDYGVYFPKQYIYSQFIGNPELIMAIKYFLNNDNFTKQVARVITADFNPFRDYSYLAEQSRKKFGFDEFLDFK